MNEVNKFSVVLGKITSLEVELNGYHIWKSFVFGFLCEQLKQPSWPNINEFLVHILQ